MNIRRILTAFLLLALVSAGTAAAAQEVEPEAEAPELGSNGELRPVFAPDTDEDYARDVLEQLARAAAGDPASAQLNSHWSHTSTALGRGGSSQGDSVELTWSVIPDGTFMPAAGAFDTSCTSNLIATFDAVYGAGVWQAEIQRVWDDWTGRAGNVYTPAVTPDADGTPIDDGAVWPGSGGVDGVRGDIRIGGCTIDGNSGVLAYNYFPSNGDMKIDAPDSAYPANSISPFFHNVFSHEHGHGAGLNHVCPVDNTKLMEPIVNTAFTGLQHDDLLGVQRHYGDRFERVGNPNDTRAAATFVSPGGGDALQQLSIDNGTETDWFRIDATAGQALNVSLTPVGQTYMEGPDPSSALCTLASPTSFNSLVEQDLFFEIRDASGILTTVDANGPGGSEQRNGFAIPATGAHYVRVRGDGANRIQLYSLTMSLDGSSLLAQDPGSTTLPGAPRAVTATRTDRSATVSWNPPASDGGDPNLTYKVTGMPGRSCTVKAPATSCTVSGLTRWKRYSFKVTATNVVGTGPASAATGKLVSNAIIDCARAPRHPFVDVSASSFADQAISCIRELGVTTGTSPTTYSPGNNVTREQMAAFIARLYRVITGESCGGTATPFIDIGESFAKTDIECIYALGVTTGTTPITYSPGADVTREQMASFLARLYRTITAKTCGGTPSGFVDVSATSFAKTDIECIKALAVTTGTSPSTYSPGANVTREQMAAFLARLYDAITT